MVHAQSVTRRVGSDLTVWSYDELFAALVKRATSSVSTVRFRTAQNGMSTESPHILVVDDDADIAKAARLLLERHGMTVAAAADPAAAWVALAMRPADVVLLDVDNGPDGLSRDANDALYGARGLRAARSALRPGGVLAVWSSGPDARFAARLRDAGFAVEEVVARARAGGRGARHAHGARLPPRGRGLRLLPQDPRLRYGGFQPASQRDADRPG